MKNNQKINFKFIHISFEDFTLENFLKIIMNNFQLNTTYSILLKISSNNNLIFKMCGHQIGIVINNENDLKFYFRKFLKKNKIRFRFSKKEFYKKFKAILKNSKTLKNYFFKYYFFTKKDAIVFISDYLRKKKNDIKIKKEIVNLIKKTKIKKKKKKKI